MNPHHEEFPPKIRIVVDSMVFLHFSFVKRLQDLMNWLKPNIVVTPFVINEVLTVSRRNPSFEKLDLQDFVRSGLICLEEMSSSEETILFYGYLNQKFKKKVFGKGESSCLAVSLAKRYGIVCDEKEVLEEFSEERQKKKFEAPAWTSFRVINLAKRGGFISREEAEEMKKGFLYG